MLVDSGFRATRDGFRFPNYGNAPGVPNLGPMEVRQLFGDGVCAGLAGGVCVLSPPALAWMQQENGLMADGHCVGLSITALFFFAHLSTPVRFGAGSVPGLKLSANQMLAREIAYAYVFQVLDSVRRAEVSGSPRQVLSTLMTALRTRSELYTLGITQRDGSAGHAVTPYEIDRLGASRYAIRVYDNNYPGTSKTVVVNTRSDSWSFQAAPTPDQAAALYTGNASTHSLLLLPTKPGLGVQPCPFCSSSSATVASASAARRATHYETVSLQGAGHLLISDARGRVVGIRRGRVIDQIPGAHVRREFVAAPRTWLEQPEPLYQLPTGAGYRIRLTGSRPRGGGRRRGSGPASVTVIEPGFIAAVRRIRISPGRTVDITVSADGHTITFRHRSGSRQSPQLVLGDAQPGHKDHQWNINAHGTPAGRTVSAGLDLARSRMSLTGLGSYDLSMDLVGNGVSVFAHQDLGLAAGVTANLDYADWSEGHTMPLSFDQSGAVVNQPGLGDQPSAETGQEFAPSEPGPAPVEPQAQPIPVRSTTTTLTCSPGEVSVSDQTTCSVVVSPASSDAAATPTGQVELSSDGAGSFTPRSCTLSDGACQVSYVPEAAGPGLHGLTARYGGDARFDSSDDTVALVVDPRATRISLECSPATVQVDAPTTCTATVSAASGAAPSGQVDFGASGSGEFSAPSCTLAGGSCQVTYTPTSVGAGSQGIGAAYGGNANDASSTGYVALQIDRRSTSTTVSCDQTTVQPGATTNCTATVTDTGPGTPSTPTGTVTFDDGGDGGAFSTNPCTLSGSGDSASCTVTYATSQTLDTVQISAVYSGDSLHAGS